METCLVCKKSFNSARGLANHYLAKHHLSGKQYKQLLPDNEVESRDYVVCPICGVRRKNLTKHLKFHKMSKEQFLSLYSDQQMVCSGTLSKMIEAAKVEYQDRKEEMAHYGSLAITKYNKSTEKWSGENGQRLRERQSKLMSSTLHRLWKTEEYRKHISAERSRRYLDANYAKKNLENLKPWWINASKTPEKKHRCFLKEYEPGMKFRSSYEYRLAKLLRNSNISYAYETLAFRYRFNESDKWYFPDFYIEQYNLVIEVKPYRFISEEINIAKKQSVCEAGYNFLFITEKELRLAESSSTIERVILEAIQG